MKNTKLHIVKLLFFYWISAFVLAVSGYYLLNLITPHRVFASWYRMITYHKGYPIQYISITVFFFGIIAAFFSKRYYKSNRKIVFSIGIVVLSILVSSPFGGILWHFHDMQAGWFPENWINKLLGGIEEGLGFGWFLMLLTFPYNLLGIISAHFLLYFGSRLAK